MAATKENQEIARTVSKTIGNRRGNRRLSGIGPRNADLIDKLLVLRQRGNEERDLSVGHASRAQPVHKLIGVGRWSIQVPSGANGISFHSDDDRSRFFG